MDPELVDLTRRFIERATRYDIDALDRFYADELVIFRLDDRGETMTLDKAANMDFFRKRKKAGAPPLDDSTEFLHASQGAGFGMVVVKRRMQLADRPEELFFTLIWQKRLEGWQVVRESVYAEAAVRP